jgi:hypothetical protein
MTARYVLQQGSILYFISEDKPTTSAGLLKDMEEGIGSALAAGVVAGAATRMLFFGIPMMPAIVQSLAGAAIVWGVAVQPTMNKVMSN